MTVIVCDRQHIDGARVKFAELKWRRERALKIGCFNVAAEILRTMFKMKNPRFKCCEWHYVMRKKAYFRNAPIAFCHRYV